MCCTCKVTFLLTHCYRTYSYIVCVQYIRIPPVVELADFRPGSALGVQLDSWNSEPDKPGKHALLHVGVLLEGHVLHNWWQL